MSSLAMETGVSRTDWSAIKAPSALSVSEVPLDRWDAFAMEFRDTVPDQTAAYATARWGAERVRGLSVGDGSRSLGGALVIDFSLPLIGRGLSVVKFGPLWRRKGETAENRALELVVSALQRHVAGEGHKALVILPLPDPAAPDLLASTLLTAGFTRRGSIPNPERYCVNLGLDLDAQRASLHSKWRYNLKQAQKAKLEIGLATGEAGLASFMQLYGAMTERKRFADHSSIDCLAAMMQAVQPEMRPEIVIVNHEGRPTAGAVISSFGDRALYLFGATDDRALPLHAGFALQWWILEHLTNRGCLWYDLGGTEGDEGLARFKRHFVGNAGVVTDRLDEYAYAVDPVSRVIASGVFALRGLQRRRAQPVASAA
ncbi:hypothetical protein FHS85_003675 [Rhodoligotrophos appendicifer]|uniref:lipid II:glycine glycyltransferase FemX n=1 Tax=Rhodoligotrophos appendicifer TaxID=987056 RepID=UPI001478C1F8|nr:GNAT family N-acetyltransferase [Rhodoligotrophos appendicifer]